MRIPLDYYQILGVSFDATPEQIQQSYEDRLQQLPKQQYSAAAIASRKKLLLEAHSILLNPTRRQEHDQRLFPDLEPSGDNLVENNALDPSVQDIGVDIDTNLLAGALILLLEFGEFDSVLELGLAQLNRAIDLEKIPDEVGPVDDDVALAVSIANLELGREHWQQGDCEEAGSCLKAGLNILRDEGKFFDIQAEIETDLSKLRPYRVLNLLALDEADPQRAEGLSLLQDMLDERGGMEGNGDDQSGLSVNDFLLFMQQLRDNLTVNEQFMLFRAESERPSSVATYLSVYAHVAQGVSEYDPALISQAKSLLAGLADRQDLSLEQGMCSLLLGQPEAAAYCVEQSTDTEAIAFINDYSAGAPDIIPGLYLYTEQWLQQEVYPYFRNLTDQTVALTDYFNDEGVQGQLSDLEPDLPLVDSTGDIGEVDAKWERWLNDTIQEDNSVSMPDNRSSGDQDSTTKPEIPREKEDEPTKTTGNWFSGLTASKSEPHDDPMEDLEIDAPDLEWAQAIPTDSAHTDSTNNAPIVNAPKSSTQKKSLSGQSSPLTPSRKKEKTIGSKSRPTKKPWVLWGASLLIGIAIVWGAFAIGRLFQFSPSTTSNPSESDSSPSVSTPEDSPGENTPNQSSDGPLTSGDLTSEAAQEIIRAWQKIKAEAMGQSYKKATLSQLLIGPELEDWERRVDLNQEEGIYTTFNLKNLTIESVTQESETEALVRAKVEEGRDEYWGEGASDPRVSLDDAYQVDYRLELIDGKWKIKSTEVL